MAVTADDEGGEGVYGVMKDEDASRTADTAPAQQDSASPPRLGRRLLILNVAAAGTAVASTARAIEPTPVQYRTGITDSDPGDGPGYGRGGYRGAPRTGVTDNDPGDGAGQGRGGYRGAPRTGITDNDPGDGAGQGRGYRAAPQGRAYTGINDGDPRDPSGYGTGWRQRGTGITDADPSDGPGRGRGGGYRPRNVTDNDPGDAPGRGRGWR